MREAARRWLIHDGSDGSPPAPAWDRGAILALSGVALLVVLTFRDYGLSWDEPFQAHYGERILRFYSSGFADRGATRLDPLQHYGGLFDALVQLLSRISPLPPVDTRHLLTAATGWLGLLGTWRLARLAGGPQAGFWAVVLLACVPSYYGHLFFNPKDLPFAVGWVWALYGLARLGETLPRPPGGLLVGLGLAMGAACGVRIAGAVLAGYLALLLALELAWTGRGGAGAARGRELAQTGGVVLAIAYGTMIAFWPSALLEPLAAPVRAFAVTTRHLWSGAILFRGEAVPAQELPWDYLPTYLGVKLPELFLALFCATLPWLAIRTARALRRRERAAVFPLCALWLGFAPPIGYAVVFRSVHFDGIRHFLFLLPPMACVAALGMAAGLRFLAQHSGGAALLALAVAVAALARDVVTLARLHPYEYVSYNALAGGLAGAAGRFELDYWATSHREAVEALTAHVAALRGGAPPYRVFVCQSANTAIPYLPRALEPTEDPEQADFYIALRRWNCPDRLDGRVVARVERMGTTLSLVKDVRRTSR